MAEYYRNVAYRARTERRMTSKVRCTNCRGYVERNECFWQAPNRMARVCTEACFNEWKDRKRPKPAQVKAKRAMKASRKPGIPVGLRMEVRARDGQTCRWCGRPGHEVHHINYRSEGGPDEASNLILLCLLCHQRAHTSKAAFKPLLLAYVWIRCTEGRMLLIPEVAKYLDRLGLLTQLQRERLG